MQGIVLRKPGKCAQLLANRLAHFLTNKSNFSVTALRTKGLEVTQMSLSNRVTKFGAAALLAFLVGPTIRSTGAWKASHVPAMDVPEVAIRAAAIEVTQATQTWLAVADRNRGQAAREIAASNEMVPLVRGKRTVVRVYPGIAVYAEGIAVAQATLTCQGIDATPCPGPASAKPASLIRIEPHDHNDLDSLRQDVTRTWNFVLPEAWTRMGVPISLTATITAPPNAPVCPACDDYANYLTLGGLVFHPISPLELHIVYACVRRNASNPPLTCDHAPLNIHEDLFHAADSLIVQTFPIAGQEFHLTLHDPITVPIDGDLTLPGGPMTTERMNEFERFVCDLAANAAHGATLPVNVIYFGIVPAPDTGVMGLGKRNCAVAMVDVPSRGPVISPAETAAHELGYGHSPRLALSSAQTVAHELGHALGRAHAGCALHGEPPPCDPVPQVFPCKGGGICTSGFDTAHLQVINPGSETDGSHVHDFMSYGGGQRWVSPYTYRHLYDTLRSVQQ
jgi:hypothetical protein